MRYAVILAGGVGSRFWPSSRISRPKQFMNLLGERTMIQMTVDRIAPEFDPDQIFVLTNKDYVPLVTGQLPEIPEENIIGEIVGKNTAPAILLMASLLTRRDPDATMVVLPADHHISQPNIFLNILRSGFTQAEASNNLVTIGIKPYRPETGYGYIQIDESHYSEFSGNKAHRVKTFAEKPDLATAVTFMESGDFLWNSGMFIWKASTILSNFEKLLPEMYLEARKTVSVPDSKLRTAIDQFFKVVVSMSIDYGIMEKADHVFVIPGDFGWSDVGSWLAVFELSKKDDNGNVTDGTPITSIDAQNNLIRTADKRHVALVGVQGLIVVDTGDTMLITRLDASQDVKKVSDVLRGGPHEPLR